LSILILRDKESQTLTTHDIRKTKGLFLCLSKNKPKNKLYEIHRCSFTSYRDKLKEKEEKGKTKERCLEVRGEELDSMTQGNQVKECVCVFDMKVRLIIY